ncbi:MAG: 5'/3'-nucleotidase SurE [bacterium]
MEDQSKQRPLVLVANDDGVEAQGLRILTAELRARFEVLVVAPDRERSAVSHWVTMAGSWRVQRLAPDTFSVDGTPADCVYLGVCQLAARTPSLVVSGVNNGYNLGTDVIYSGTVAAAAEAAVLGIPSVAISAEAGSRTPTFEQAARFATALAGWIIDQRWAPPWTFLNVNVPADTDGDRFGVGAMGTRRYQRAERQDLSLRNELEERVISLYRPFAAGTHGAQGEDSDILRQKMIAVSPLRLDWTAIDQLDLAQRMSLDGFESDSAGSAAGEGQGRRDGSD